MESNDTFELDRSPMVGSSGREYVVLSRADAEDLSQCAYSVPHAVISIGDALSPDAQIPQSDLRRALLRLKFDDLNATFTVDAAYGYKPDQARRVAEFVRSTETSVRLVVHCQFGISRSAAMIKAIAEALGDHEVAEECSRRYQPNRWVYTISADVFRTELQTHP